MTSSTGLLTPEQNPALVLGPGAASRPTRTSRLPSSSRPTFYKQAAEVVAASDCSMPFPTITEYDGRFELPS